MTTLLHVTGWWILLSLAIGPCLTWLFFYGERAERDAPPSDQLHFQKALQ